jgi:hypothetical protein
MVEFCGGSTLGKLESWGYTTPACIDMVQIPRSDSHLPRQRSLDLPVGLHGMQMLRVHGKSFITLH